MLNNCISVIIPNYNNERYVEAAIMSCIQQGEALKEVIVIDDMSTDSSLFVLQGIKKKFPDKFFYYINENKGGNNARNLGFSKSSGDFIQWLDSDDVILKGKFQAQLALFERDSTIDVVYSDWCKDIYDQHDNLEKRIVHRKKSYDDFLYEILSDNWSAQHSYLYRRSLASKLHDLKAWNPETKIAQDREYVTIAALLGSKFSYTSGIYAPYHQYPRESVSTLSFDVRLGYQLEQDEKYCRILVEGDFSTLDARRYISLLNAHALNACFYAPKLMIRYPFSLLNVNWKIIHYKKYPLIPFIYAWQHLMYFYISLRTNLMDEI